MGWGDAVSTELCKTGLGQTNVNSGNFCLLVYALYVEYHVSRSKSKLGGVSQDDSSVHGSA